MRRSPGSSRPLAIAAFALILAGCNGLATKPLPQAQAPLQSARRHGAADKIQHVVIIIQENRSLNNLFNGFRGAKTQSYGYGSSGQKITLQPVGLATSWDIDHSSTSFFAACNGTGSIPGTNCQMNGFDKENWECGKPGYPACPNSDPPYSYVPHTDAKPYFDMAKRYVLADQMYASNFDGSSFISHQYIIAGQAEAAVNYPPIWGCEGGPGDIVFKVGLERQIPNGQERPCFDDVSLGQEADNAGISWAYYTVAIHSGGIGLWSAYQANQYVYYGPDWQKDVISPPSNFLNDISNGKLRQISWVTPSCANSDHPGCNSNTGPQWVASIVNVIGQSKYWNNTAIFIFWDDYGGWYDPEPPAYLDYDGLGIRVPLIVISAYAKKGYVSHVHYEHGSILRFVENRFGLARLSASDSRATSPENDCFDFRKPPRKFKVIPTVLDKNYFLHQPPDLRPPDTE